MGVRRIPIEQYQMILTDIPFNQLHEDSLTAYGHHYEDPHIALMEAEERLKRLFDHIADERNLPFVVLRTASHSITRTGQMFIVSLRQEFWHPDPLVAPTKED